MSENTSKKQETWNHTTPVVFSPLFDWPPKPKDAFLVITKRWVTISRNVFFLTIAILLFRYLVPDDAVMRSLSLRWIGPMFLRNYLFMLVIAGGLHLYFFTFRLQGSRLKYDPREQLEKSRKFSFRNQVWDNIFWSLASGTTIWSIYEGLYFWGVANDVISTLSIGEHPIVFVAWLLAMPVLTSSHFYFIHRLLHWPPLYRSVHRLHHRNIHTGPWSGMSMHPFEHIIYLSSVLVHFVIPSHPIILLLHLYSRCLGPAFSHAGFEKLKVGDTSVVDAADFHHQLHHCYFECNYGTVDAPWDKWFGTDHDGSDQAKTRIQKQRTASSS
ncbi:MAG: sterol desaturase family protein [Verrucomicrobiota bacterium]|nr:sterol desaturase family protein [Verrucomicrobiota bacterium]MDG1893230.1 sterol desaturase family protein [Verrucomicrobiota bacterium]